MLDQLGDEEQRELLKANHPLVAARKIYERAGFRLTKEEKHRSFGHDLVGQSFALDLVARGDIQGRHEGAE